MIVVLHLNSRYAVILRSLLNLMQKRRGGGKAFQIGTDLNHSHCIQQAAPKKQHIVKTAAATLNKSKKRKRFFLFF
jgi:hypothetical protein